MRNFKRREGLSASGMNFFHRLFAAIKANGCCVGLEISARAISLDCVAPFRNTPDEFDLWLGGGFRQTNANGFVSGRFDIAKIHQTCQSCGPQASNWTAAGVEREMRA